jgi:hypothetical protein
VPTPESGASAPRPQQPVALQTAGSFSVLESRATRAPDVVYLENKIRVFYLDSETEVHRYSRAFDLISAMALDPEASRDVIRRAADAL